MKKSEKSQEEPRPPEEISWNAAEHEYVKKDIRWYLVVGGLTLFFLILAIWQSNYFFAVFIVIAGAILASSGKRHPKVFTFRVNGEGVFIGEKFIAFEQLESFTIRERPAALHELIVKQKTYVNPYLHIPLDGETAERARALLGEKIPEEEYKESLLDIFADWLGF
ncbi:MAG: hypothetical protein Q8P88_03280 [Candidatus Jorgensenbacteria bacterium]|nr:hypothetical protein [Candidatus Jorgensenbacteria bacterium]